MSRLARTAAAFALAFIAAGPGARAAAAQEAAPAPAPIPARNAFYVELLGNGLIYSVNYDRRLTDNLAGRVGFAFVSGEDSDGDRASIVIAPVMGSYLFGEGNSHFEAGLGVLLASASVEDVGSGDEDWFDETVEGSTVLGTGVLGYRYQRPDGGFVFRVGLTPVFTTSDFAPWFGISFGYGF